ncbi:hypothetical protein GIB67_026299, partial [Kingdonia uniflora]
GLNVSNHQESKWSGVSETRGDLFSYHKLTIQFYDAFAPQDTKLEGLVHKAIQELWRPNLSELIVLLTKGVNYTFLKVSPSVYTLTGSSDPCNVEAYHLADSSDEKIILHLKFCEGSRFKATAAQQYGASPCLSGLKFLASKPFHKVCSHILRTVAEFQLCFAAKNWYGGFVGMMIFDASEVSRNVDLGDETTTMMCKFVARASNASIIKEIESDLQGWLDNISDGDVEYMPEEDEGEQEDGSVEKKKKKKKNEIKTDEEDGKPKGPSTPSKLTAEEVGVFQAAVLQEWHTLCKERGGRPGLLKLLSYGAL